MEYKFSREQIRQTKKAVHSMVHWLLLYVEQDYDREMLDQYFKTVLYRISGLNEVMGENYTFVLLLSTLRAAKTFLSSEDYNYSDYRRLILDAHTLIDKSFEGADE